MGHGGAPIRDGTTDTTDVAVVGIVDDASGATCTGALIAPDLVLTAQHCVATAMNVGPCTQGTFGPPRMAGDYFVTTRTTMSLTPSDYHGVVEIVVPPGSGFCDRDVALMRLATQVAAGEAAPIAVRLEPRPVVAEVYAAVGYGATDDLGTGTGERRRRDGLAVACVGGGCASTFVGLAEWRGEAGVCQGDSGGPALDSSGAVLGVASRGAVGCVAPVYADLSAHADWLVAEAVRAAGLGGYPPPAWTGVAPPVDAGAAADAPGPATDAPAALDAGERVDEPGGCCRSSTGDVGGAALLAIAVLVGLRCGGPRGCVRRIV